MYMHTKRSPSTILTYPGLLGDSLVHADCNVVLYVSHNPGGASSSNVQWGLGPHSCLPVVPGCACHSPTGVPANHHSCPPVIPVCFTVTQACLPGIRAACQWCTRNTELYISSYSCTYLCAFYATRRTTTVPLPHKGAGGVPVCPPPPLPSSTSSSPSSADI
eukprot:1138478-Pelagomonas_calceolata.AAC.2